jgi:RNA 2',3'-cyclic 3'-phosphodiesterase
MTDQLLFPGMSAAPLTDGLFLALFPDAATAARIADLTRQLRDKYALTGRPHAAERLHVSLHGIGEYASFPNEVASRVIEAAAAIAMRPFDIGFDRVMSFSGKPGQLPFVLRGEAVAELIAFQKILGAAMQKAGLGRAKAHYAPHMTLLYDTRRVDEQPIETIRWTAREFVLVHSLLGRGVYKSLGRWPLRG